MWKSQLGNIWTVHSRKTCICFALHVCRHEQACGVHEAPLYLQHKFEYFSTALIGIFESEMNANETNQFLAFLGVLQYLETQVPLREEEPGGCRVFLLHISQSGESCVFWDGWCQRTYL